MRAIEVRTTWDKCDNAYVVLLVWLWEGTRRVVMHLALGVRTCDAYNSSWLQKSCHHWINYLYLYIFDLNKHIILYI